MTRATIGVQPYYQVASEEELKAKVAKEFFNSYDCTKTIGRIDFSVYPVVSHKMVDLEITPFFWAEVKRDPQDIYAAITQLIITIGQQRTFDKHLPPHYVGAFDSEKIAFVPYNEVQDIFYMNDFNWNVRPSDHTTKEFIMVYERVVKILEGKTLWFLFEKDKEQLKEFIKNNFYVGRTQNSKIKIDRNNFVVIYQRWLDYVKPTIAVDWEKAKKVGIIDGDFYLADLLSKDDKTILDNLYVVLNVDHYEMMRKINEMGLLDVQKAFFKDGQKKYREFWSKYERPPKEEYHEYIIQRRDLLVPQDVRERKGSFFTPRQWVELAHEYIAKALGENWQDEYYIWDCAAGTGNLLNGLINKYHIWVSTLDQQDVDTMKQRIANGANLLEKHVFQFDFLNDDFKPQSQGGKLPDNLYDVITDPEKQKKLLILINPPYAEAGNAKVVAGTGQNKVGVSNRTKTHQEVKKYIGAAAKELFAQFMARIYITMPNCKLSIFSTPKFIQGSNFSEFRKFFKSKYLGGFAVPAYTFDNVKGKFPITFTIWDCAGNEEIKSIECDVYDDYGLLIGQKHFRAHEGERINKWITQFRDDNAKYQMGHIACSGPDFQHQNQVFIQNGRSKEAVDLVVTPNNLIPTSVYLSVRHCIKANWLNNRDQFYYPDGGWQEDLTFQSDCVIFTLFHSQNKMTSASGTNHWIPFSESEVSAKAKFRSDFMYKFLNGQWDTQNSLLPIKPYRILDHLSPEAKAVYEVGLKIWRYYHSKSNANPDASLYDIKEYFKGRDENGRLRQKSSDETFNALMEELKEALERLAEKIAEKAYEYGFLKR